MAEALTAAEPPRARLPLVLRDLAAGAAFGAMAVSGSLPIWSIAAFGVGLLLALLNKRPLANRGTLTAAGLALVAVVLYASVAAGGLDLVVAACTLSGLIGLHRLLSATTRRTDNQVHLTSLLMIAGGAALSGELLFGLFLSIYAALASFSIGLSVVEAALPPGERLPVRPALRQLAVGAAFAVAGAIAFFVVFPRLSWNLAAHRTAPGLGAASAGFSDRIRLSGDGSIKTNPRVVLRATLSPDPRRARLDAYWLGRTFDRFDGHEWVGRASPSPAGTNVDLRPGSRDGRAIHQRIELLPAYGARTLVALDPPGRMGNGIAHSASGNVRTTLSRYGDEEVRFDIPAIGYAYQAYSLPAEAVGPDPRAWGQRERFLELPPKLDPRVTALAKQIVGGERDPLTAGRKVESYLRREYRYTLELADVEDPLVSFLFERREGHCEHFATALVMLLRAAGIPARAAAGFYGGERIGDAYIVRAGDAHAWAQVLTQDKGFVTLDATPDDGRASQATALLGWLTRQYETLEALWRQSVLDYSFWDQVELARSLVRPPDGASQTRGAGNDWRPSNRALGAAAAFVVAYAVLRRLLRRRGATPAGPATHFAAQLERILERHGISPRPGEDLETLTRRVVQSGHPIGAPLSEATRRYLLARFGGKPLAPGEAQALLRALREVEPVPARSAA